jgi:ABC-type glycerol-3-phosphate transport system substrate-binding protein
MMKNNIFPGVSACGSGASTGETASGGESASTAGVNVRVWTHQNDAFNDGLKALADTYMADHPDVSITFETFDYDTYIQTLQTALPAGTEADILQMFGSWVCSYAEGDNLAPVPEDVLSMADAKEAIFPAQLAGYDCDNTLYGVPQEFNIEYGATLVNTAMAADAGVDVSKGWDNWDDFIADAKAMTVVQDDVMLRAGYNFTGSDGIPATFYSLILQNGGEYLTSDGFEVDTPEGLAALELMKKMVDEGVVDPVLFNDEENWVGDCFFEGNCAMGLVGPWVMADYGGDYPDIVDITQYVALPYIGSEPKLVAASGWGLSVSANSKVQDAAWDFVKYVALDPDNAVQWNLASGTLPALKANAIGAARDKLVAEFPYFGPFLDILQYAQNEGAFPDRDLVWYDITYPRVLEYLQGNATAEDTLQTIDREVTESM